MAADPFLLSTTTHLPPHTHIHNPTTPLFLVFWALPTFELGEYVDAGAMEKGTDAGTLPGQLWKQPALCLCCCLKAPLSHLQPSSFLSTRMSSSGLLALSLKPPGRKTLSIDLGLPRPQPAFFAVV